MKIVILIFYSLFPLFLPAQEVSIIHGQDYDSLAVSPFLRSLYAENDHVISFRVKFKDTKDEMSDYFVLTRKANELHAYNYLHKTGRLQQLGLAYESMELVWKTFLQNNLFNIRNENDIANFCPEKYQVYNSYSYEFLILSKGKMKRLSYYDPEYYDNACYGIAERKMIVNSASVINYVLRK